MDSANTTLAAKIIATTRRAWEAAQADTNHLIGCGNVEACEALAYTFQAEGVDPEWAPLERFWGCGSPALVCAIWRELRAQTRYCAAVERARQLAEQARTGQMEIVWY